MTLGNPSVEVFPATALTDVELLRPALESAVRHPLTGEVFTDEIEGYLQAVDTVRQGLGDKYYAIAQTSGGLTVGMMGLERPGPEVAAFATTDNPIELVNAYVLKSSRDAGVGRALVRHLEDKARADGHTELLLNSGPRYQRSGWPFWRKMYGEPVGSLPDYYGAGFDAMVWRTSLEAN
jgi:GNAT superfamily N-acetyltransferase